MKTKLVVLLAGAVVALLLLSRYFALSQTGLPLGWMVYLGLPITAGGVLCALRLINLGAGWGSRIESAPARPPAIPPPDASVGERLKELAALHATGAISDTEYAAWRLHIIATSKESGPGRY